MFPLFYITHLYPDEMNIYGDMGNIISLQKRLTKLGFQPVYQKVHSGEKLPEKTDFYFIGGGQDKEQILIFKDLLTKKERLKNDVENNTVILAICGGYQLLGHKFLTGDGNSIDGLGILDIETKAPSSDVKSRCVGDLFAISQIPDIGNYLLVGFENHSGQTYFLSQKVKPLGKVIYGFGNNATEKLEGARYKNVFGTYLHGSILPKNPNFTDYLISQAIRRKTERGEINPKIYLRTINQHIDNKIAITVRENLIKKYNLQKISKSFII